MFAKFVVFALALVAVSAQFPPAKNETVWEEMIAMMQQPQIAMSIDCVDPKTCYVAGMSNGVGPGVYSYDGQIDGTLKEMDMPKMTMMIIDLVARNSKAGKPVGAFSGFGIGNISTPLQYLTESNGTLEWKASSMPQEFIFASQTIGADENGETIVAAGQGPFIKDKTQTACMVSADQGATFTVEPVLWSPPDNCSFPNSIVVTSKDTWYMTFGSDPSTSSSVVVSPSGASEKKPRGIIEAKFLQDDEVIVSRKAQGRVLYIQNSLTKEFRMEVIPMSEYRQMLGAVDLLNNNKDKCGFSGYVAKTTDAGKTWNPVYTSADQCFGTDSLACLDENHCTAVSFNAQVSTAVVTTDGSTWKTALTVNAATGSGLQGAVYENSTSVWLVGSQESQTSASVEFWHSNDAGVSYTKYDHQIPGVAVVMSIDFTGPADNRVGFALGLTLEKTSTILRYATQPYYGYFAQKNCLDAKCSVLCQSVSFAQGLCLPLNGGGSVRAFCESTGLAQYAYTGSENCSGHYNKTVAPLNQCMKGGEAYFENICDAAAAHSGINSAQHNDMLPSKAWFTLA